MSNRLRVIIFLAASIGVSFSARSSDFTDCPSLLSESFRGKQIEFTRAELEKVGGRFVPISSLFPEGYGLLVGIQEDGHVYLVADGIRYDGGSIYKWIIRKPHATNALPSGWVMSLNGLSPDVVAHLRKNLSELSGLDRWSMSCYHGACSRLKKVGINLGGDGSRAFFAATLFERMMNEGFIGPASHKIPVDVFQLGNVSLKKIRNQIHADDTALLPTVIVLTSLGIAAYYLTPETVENHPQP
ncbi:MAG: hypothetical protein H7301_07905 [Cryobacterium sp.]|nr:hypothetical protein [Oligoflexia bacterium]